MRSTGCRLVLAACVIAAGCSSSGGKSNADAGRDAPGDVARDGGEAADLAADLADAGGDALNDAGAADDGGACPVWTGDRQFGTGSDDAVLALATWSTGVVAGGYAGGTLGVTAIEPAGDARGFVRALSATGAILWETAVDATGTETVEAVATDATGGLAIVGRTTGAFPGFANRGQQDAFVAWLSPGGVLGDVRQLGDERPQNPRRIVFMPTGVAVAGYDDIYIMSSFVVDWENPFFATVGASPTAEPAFHPARTSTSDRAEGLALDPLGSGDFFLTGVVENGTQRGLFMRRVGADGSLRWSSRLSSIGLEVPGPLVALPDGTLWLTAAWLRANDSSDVVLLHVDAASGASLGSFDFPSPDGAEEVTGLARDARGDFWISGSVFGRSFPGATPAGDYDAFVFHVASDGTFINGWQAGTPGPDFGSALALDACGNVIIGGSTSGALVPGATSLGGMDAFVMRVPFEGHP